MSLNLITKLSVLILLPLLFTAVSCNKPTEPTTGNVTITVEDASCTEVWLAVNTGNISLPGNFILYENNTRKTEITLTQRDTIIVIENLLPKQNYSYKLMNSNNVSNETLAITLDTTSHNFTWQTFEFGQHSSSVLYDVAIIDENNIWAVGEIYMNDPLGNPDPTFYNAVHWNGTDWELKKIFYKGGIWTIRTIFAFNGNDIWFSGYMRYLNGQFIELTIPNILMGWQINKLWGSSSNDLYAVGDNGNIAHWNGSSWKKIESPIGTSGTDMDLLDVWGSPDGSVVWICGEEDFKPTVLLKYSNNTLEKVIEDTENLFHYNDSIISGGIHSIWTNDNNKLFVQTWFDLYRIPANTKGEAKALWKGNPNTWGVESLRANDINDLIAAGVYSRIWHFNGVSWKRYENVIDQKDILYEIEIKGNIAVSVGHRYYNGVENFGLIHLGKR